MCLAKAYIVHDQGEELLTTNVALVKVEGTQVILTTILNESKTLEAVIEQIDYANSNLKLRLV
jgi:predicted RNA-binding protein